MRLVQVQCNEQYSLVALRIISRLSLFERFSFSSPMRSYSRPFDHSFSFMSDGWDSFAVEMKIYYEVDGVCGAA